jgi:hypothetical protein
MACINHRTRIYEIGEGFTFASNEVAAQDRMNSRSKGCRENYHSYH